MLDLKEATPLAGDSIGGRRRRALRPAPERETADNVYSPPRHLASKANPRVHLGQVYTIRSAGEVLDLKTHSDNANMGYTDRAVGGRGAVHVFSDKSRRRLAKACASVAWGSFPFLFVTLTYSGEFPMDGRISAGHLRAFRERWQRRYGMPLAVWKREFQRRGAVHFHLAILAPEGVPMVEVRRWVTASWSEIVGAPSRTAVEVMRKPPVAYFSCHGQHGRDRKDYQNVVPEGFTNPGRFWGFWNLAPQWDEFDLTSREFVQARRILRAWARSKGRRQHRNGGRVQGQWFRSRNRPAYLLVADVMRALPLALS